MIFLAHLITRKGLWCASGRRGHPEGNAMRRNEQLRRLRIGRSWRQQDLADRLGITVITIQRWERGSQSPSAYYRAKLCTLFNKSPQELGLEEDFPASESITADV